MDRPADDLNNAFGDLLRRARETAGLAQEDLAERAGLSINTVGGLERGEHRHPYPATVRALAGALGLTDSEQAKLVASVSKRDRRTAPATADRPGLRVQLATLIGRECEVNFVTNMILQDGVRLVTLTGPGGVGKTVLALRTGESLAPNFAHGTIFVSLAPVLDPELIPATIAHSLGLADIGKSSPLQRLQEALHDRHMLLILDNFEHLIEAAPLISDLRTGCPNLSVLATSRATLRLAGEHVIPVLPLPVPDPDQLLLSDELAEVPAVRLFVARATATNPAFHFSDLNAGAVASICHRLEGLPLAIELAAARTSTFPPAELLPLLARRLPLLTVGRRDAPERHRTMRDAIAWSYDLLPRAEQELFRRLAIFVGGFTLDAAMTVVNSAGRELVDTIAGLATLVDHSLLRHERGPGAQSRYFMLETLREYGLERLEKAGEERSTRFAHSAYFSGLDGRLDPNRLDFNEHFDDRLLRIEAEHPNCRTALTHMAEIGDDTGVLRLAGALAAFWNHRGHLREGRQWLEWALERSDDVTPILRGRAMAGLSLLLLTQGDPGQAEPLAVDACTIGETVDDAELLALAVHMIGLVEFGRNNWDRAEEVMSNAYDIQRAIGTSGYGAMALTILSEIAHRKGEIASSARQAEEALEKFREIGHSSGAAMALCRLATLALVRGNELEALAAYQEALRLWASIGERWAIAFAFGGIAILADEWGQFETAACFLGVVDARLIESGAEIWLGDHMLLARAAEHAKGALGETRFAECRAAGMARPLTSALADALSIAQGER